MKFFDTHCHLNLDPLLEEFDQILVECQKQKCYANIVGTSIQTSLKAIELAKKSNNQFFAIIGLHPADLEDEQTCEKDLKQLENILSDINNRQFIVGIGETGMDFFHLNGKDKNDLWKLQKKVFLKHFELAKKYDLPLMLHIRDAHDEMIETLKEINHYGIVHCFNLGFDYAQKYLDLKNWYISIPGIVTFKKTLELQEAVKQIPLEKILIETDGPWLAPVPFRGKTNYPYYSIEVLKKIAELKEIDLEQCAAQIWKNTMKVFKLDI